MKSFKSIRVALVLFAGIQLCQSCYYDNEQNLYHLSAVSCSTINAKFTADVLPIITNNCATVSCHNTTAVGGVTLQTYDQIYAKVARIKQRTLVDKTMPPNGALTPSEINIIQCWINAGAPNN